MQFPPVIFSHQHMPIPLAGVYNTSLKWEVRMAFIMAIFIAFWQYG